MKNFDVVIVGGGLIGMSIAFELAPQKLRVAVFDQQEPGREASWAAAGMLSPSPEFDSDSKHDSALVPLKLVSLRQYEEFVATVEAASGKSAGYVRHGALEIILPSANATDGDERIARYKGLGITAFSVSTTEHDAGDITGRELPAIWLPDEATVEPRPLFDAVLVGAQRRGVNIQSHRRVTGLLLEGGRCTGVLAGEEEIRSEHVVIAAGSFSGEILANTGKNSCYAPTRPVRGQMIAFRQNGRKALPLSTVLRSERGYLVPRRNGQIVAGSTLEEAGFEKQVTSEGIRKIKDAAVELMPSLAKAEVVETWCGLRPGTPDDLPILGPTDLPGLLMATGHYRNGILLAPITAKLVRDWIVNGQASLEAAAFTPMRFASGETRAQVAYPRS